MKCVRVLSIAALTGMALAGSTRAATISYKGAQLDIDPKTIAGTTQTGATSGWRFPSTPHTFTVGNNTIYGTDGYDLFTTSALSTPSYVASITKAGAATPYGPSTGYVQINDPATNTAASQSGNEIQTGTFYYNGVSNGTQQNMFSFALSSSAVIPQTIRIGLLFDNTDGTQNGIQFQVTGAGGDSGLISQAAAGNQQPDWYFFDIVNGANNDTFTVSLKNNGPTQAFQVGGIAFDSVPEPASLGVLAFAALGLLGRRRNRLSQA